MSDTRVWIGCKCYSPDHYLLLSGDDPDPDVPADQRRFWVYVGSQSVFWRWRLRECWNVLRGRPRHYAEIVLDKYDAQQFSDTLRAWYTEVSAAENGESPR